MMSIGQKIRELRENQQMTQEELAKIVGTTKQTIYKYENSIITNIPLDKIQLIAKALNTTPAYLMGWSDTPEESDKPASATSSLPQRVTAAAAHIDFSKPGAIEAYEKAIELVASVFGQNKNN